MSHIRSVRESNLDVNTIYIKGKEEEDNSWRVLTPESGDPDGTFQVQRREPLTEVDIALDDAKVASVQGNPIYTSTNQYFASVLTDTRSNLNVPFNLGDSQVGNVISWDGNAWRFSDATPDPQWFTREKFASNLTEILAPSAVITHEGRPVLQFESLGGTREEFATIFPLGALVRFFADRIGASRVIAVYEEADFFRAAEVSGPVAGKIPLVRFRHYFIDDNVTVNFPFLMPTNGPVEFSSDNLNNNDLRCRIGAQALFQGTNSAGIVIRDLAIEDRDGGVATLFDMEQVDSESFSKVIITDATFIEFASLGKFKGFNSLKWRDNRLALYDEGITFESTDIGGGSGNLYLGLLEGGAVDVTIDGTNGTFVLNGEAWSQDDNAVAMDIKSASTISQATVTNSTYAVPTGGSFFASGSKDQTDPSYRFEVNGELADSNIIASASFSENADVTTIGIAGTPVAVNGTTAAGPLERFTHDSNGILTYTGTRDITMRIELRASIDIPGVGAGRYIETDNIAFCAFKNGIAELTTRDVRNIASVFQTPTSPQFVAVDNIELSPGDTIQMFVENEDNPTNIIVTDLKMLING